MDQKLGCQEGKRCNIGSEYEESIAHKRQSVQPTVPKNAVFANIQSLKLTDLNLTFTMAEHCWNGYIHLNKYLYQQNQTVGRLVANLVLLFIAQKTKCSWGSFLKPKPRMNS